MLKYGRIICELRLDIKGYLREPLYPDGKSRLRKCGCDKEARSEMHYIYGVGVRSRMNKEKEKNL